VKQLKTGNVVLCEYVAKSEGGKFTLVNVYGGDVLVSNMPARLHLGLYIEFLPDIDGELELDVVMELDSQKIEVKGALAELQKGSVAVIHLPGIQFSVNNLSELNVYLRSPGYRITKVLTKKISLMGQIVAS